MVNNTPPRIVLFDLDDTLTISKQHVTTEMAEVFSQLLDHVPVAIVSGALFEQQYKQLISSLPATTKFENLYSFPQNAAACVTYKDGQWNEVYSFKFTDDEVREITEALLIAIDETHIVDNEPSYGERIENRGAQVTFSALGQEAPIEAKKVFDPDQAKRRAVRDILLNKIPSYQIGIGGGTSIDITKKGIDKTYAISWLSKELSIPVKDMLYIGDSLGVGGNDAVVIPTGIPVHATKNPEETILIIKDIIASLS